MDNKSKAEALKAINTAKHKAAGATHRVEIDIFGAKSGKYKQTIVLYPPFEPTPSQINAFVLKNGGSISLSVSRTTAI